MKLRSYKYYIRKSHRYLGIFIGIQFLMWTLGGLYFSWTDIEEIRGEHLRRENPVPDLNRDLVSPRGIVEEIRKDEHVATIEGVRVIDISGAPHYEFTVADKHHGSRFVVADAVTGRIRPEVTREEAEKIALAALKEPQKIEETEYLTEKNVGGHHEYREQPLPAWAVTFGSGLTVYVSAANGQVRSFRTNKWRIFDFLWMLHTMDYYNRDDFNNYILRAFSILGIATIISGFLLFFVSSRLFRKKRGMVNSEQ